MPIHETPQLRIALTGGSGMVGCNFLEHSNCQHHKILAPSHSELDLCDKAAVYHWMSLNEPDIVVHAAGRVGGIQANIREPVSFFLDNLDMGRNVVVGAQLAGVRKLINLGSSCMYPREAMSPLNEDQILNGKLEPTNEGYALAKISIARLCKYISQENSSFHYKTVVPCNIYGPFDKFDPKHSHMVPALIHKIHKAIKEKSKVVEIWGDGKARREFMYAGDLTNFIWQAIEHFDTLPDIINAGLGHDLEVNEYYKVVADVLGFKGTFSHDLRKPVGMNQKLVDISQAINWGWSPKVSISDGIAFTYEYYLKNIKNEY